MEKESGQPESLATITIKPDYPPSEAYSSEPPPAYHRPKSAAVQVAKIISFTIIAVSILLGCFLLASAYVTANASCKQLEQELQFLAETEERLQPRLQPEALTQDEQAVSSNVQAETIQPEITEKSIRVQEIHDNNISPDSSESTSSDESSDEDDKTIHFKMPLELDFDDLAGALMEKNQKSRMNCIVEKKRAEQVVDHQAKTIQLPFGLNLTTDPRFEHVSGERMAIFCESGTDQRQHQAPEENEDTIMIQPVMIPMPPPNFHTHMPMQAASQATSNRIPQPMEGLRPPMPAAPMMQQSQQHSSGFPPNQILQHIAQQIIAQKIQMEAERNREESQSNEVTEPEQQQHNAPPEFMMAHRIPIAEDVLSQINRLPNRDVFIAMSAQEPIQQHQREIQIMRQREDAQDDDGRQEEYPRLPVNLPIRLMHIQPSSPVEMKPQAGSEQETMEPEVQIMQQQRENAQGLNGRQGYARDFPINLPVRVMQVEPDAQAAASSETRPHYVHPRSVRSVDDVLPKSTKRVKRCACDCAC